MADGHVPVFAAVPHQVRSGENWDSILVAYVLDWELLCTSTELLLSGSRFLGGACRRDDGGTPWKQQIVLQIVGRVYDPNSDSRPEVASQLQVWQDISRRCCPFALPPRRKPLSDED